MAVRIQLRRDTAANWSSTNPVLNNGEPGFDTTNKILKIGDGVTAWNDLDNKFATDAQGALADSALQPGDIGVTVQGYSANTVIDANYNTFTTTEKNKLAGIESNATADQTGAEIKSLYESESDTNAYTDAEKTKLAGIASGAEVNVQSDWDAISGDAFILNKPSTFPPSSHTQTASTITDFDTEVSNNTDVAANTAARHDAVTVVDSSEIDFTLTGQQITASIVAGSIDESKLDASVNASLDLADSALQSQTFNESIVIYLGSLDTDIATTTKAAIIPYLPYNLEVSELVLEVDTAPTGSNIEVDINVDGVSFLTTIISIDATETSSTTAATAYAIDTTTFPNSRIPKGSTVTVDIDQPGTTVAGQNLVLVINGVRY